jgi:arylsulfatase A-like enzyme
VREFSQIIFVFLWALLGISCKPTPTPSLSFLDLTRLPIKIQKFQFSELSDLSYHWKKNPARYAKSCRRIEDNEPCLGSEKLSRWTHTQFTINTNTSLFLNESKDSLLLTPGSRVDWDLPSGHYRLRFAYSCLPNREGFDTKGLFQVKAGDRVVYEDKELRTTKNYWKNHETNIELESSDPHLSMGLDSDHAICVIGHPVLFPQKEDPKENVILVVIDSARKDAFGFMGSPFPATPHLDTLAKESIVFQNTFSNGNWTKPSMISMIYSEYASNLGLGNAWFGTKANQRIVFYGKERESLVEGFRRAGYYTATIMNNVFFLDYTTVGVDLGFHDSYQVGKDNDDTDAITKRSLRFFKENKDNPFFVHINYNTPHASYSPPDWAVKELVEKSDPKLWNNLESPIKRFLGEVRYTDEEFGKLITELKNLGLYDNTWIVITGDHGDLFSTWHDYSHHFIIKTRFGHGETHYDEEINVPWIIKPPKKYDFPNQFVKGQQSLVSLTPTLLSLVGIPYQKEGMRGIDYSEYIKGKSALPEEKFIFTEGRMSESIRTKEYKYIRRYQGFDTVSKTSEGEIHRMPEELYDLVKDPEERVNLSQDPNSISLLNRARMDRLKEDFLKLNAFYINFPCKEGGCDYSGDLFVNGGIYDVEWEGEGDGLETRRYHFQTKPGQKNYLMKIKVIHPDLGFQFQLRKKGQSVPFRVGSWGILNSVLNRMDDPRLIVTSKKPSYEKENLPWVWMEAPFYRGAEKSEDKAMGLEVRKVLESWGYIHE